LLNLRISIAGGVSIVSYNPGLGGMKKRTRAILFILIQFLTPAMLGLICLILFNLISKKSSVSSFIQYHWIGIAVAAICLVITFFSTSENEGKTFGDFDEETETTLEAKKKNIKIWALFWTIWTLYFSLSALFTNSFTIRDHFFIMALATSPGVIGAVVSEYMRASIIKDEERQKRSEGADYKPYYLTTKRRYLPGYYGLICLPIYVITIAIGLLIKSVL